MKKSLCIVTMIIVIFAWSLPLWSDEDEKSGEEINWQVISNGGTDGSSTNYGLKGTVGQTATGYGSSDSYDLGHGFWQVFGGGGAPCQGMCGDANGDSGVNIADGVWIINYIFAGGLPPQPVLACGDANTDAGVNIADGVWIINYIFAGGGPPGDCSPGSPNWGGQDCCPFVP